MTKAGATVVACNKITKPAERIDFVRAEIRRAGGTTTPMRSPRWSTRWAPTCGSWPRRPVSWSPTPAAWSTRRRSGAITGEGRGQRVHRVGCGDGRRSAGRAGVAALGGRASGVAPVLIADALADGVRTIARVHGVTGWQFLRAGVELGMPPWKIDRAQGWPAGLDYRRSGRRDGGRGRPQRVRQGRRGGHGIRPGEGGDRSGGRARTAVTEPGTAKSTGGLSQVL